LASFPAYASCCLLVIVIPLRCVSEAGCDGSLVSRNAVTDWQRPRWVRCPCGIKRVELSRHQQRFSSSEVGTCLTPLIVRKSVGSTRAFLPAMQVCRNGPTETRQPRLHRDPDQILPRKMDDLDFVGQMQLQPSSSLSFEAQWGTCVAGVRSDLTERAGRVF